MGQHGRQEINLIAVEPPDCDIIHLTVGFEFAEDPFLGTPSVMKAKNLLHPDALVGHHNFELMPVFMRHEQIHLNRSLLLHLAALTDKNKSIPLIPFLWLPPSLKVRQFPVETTPPLTPLDYPLQLGESFKGYR